MYWNSCYSISLRNNFNPTKITFVFQSKCKKENKQQRFRWNVVWKEIAVYYVLLRFCSSLLLHFVWDFHEVNHLVHSLKLNIYLRWNISCKTEIAPEGKQFRNYLAFLHHFTTVWYSILLKATRRKYFTLIWLKYNLNKKIISSNCVPHK